MYILIGDQVIAVLAGPVTRLTDEIDDLTELGCQFRPVADHTRTLFDHFRHPARREMLQILFTTDRTDELRIAIDCLVRPVHPHGEIGLHFEELLEILIELV